MSLTACVIGSGQGGGLRCSDKDHVLREPSLLQEMSGVWPAQLKDGQEMPPVQVTSPGTRTIHHTCRRVCLCVVLYAYRDMCLYVSVT